MCYTSLVSRIESDERKEGRPVKKTMPKQTAPTLNKMMSKALGLERREKPLKQYTVIIWIMGREAIGLDIEATGSPAAVAKARTWAAEQGFSFMRDSAYIATNGSSHPGTFGPEKRVAWFQIAAHK